MAGRLSTTTLSLKFMQNANRAKNLAQVELEQAKVKDANEWHVSDDTKASWGISSTSQHPAQSVSYEPSYLPFLFPSLPDPSTQQDEAPGEPQKFRGRRKFDKHGNERALDAPAEEAIKPEVHDWTDGGNMQPASISGSGGSKMKIMKNGDRSTNKRVSAAKPGGGPGVKKVLGGHGPGLTMIDGGPGPSKEKKKADAPPPVPVKAVPVAATGFMKPGGVDAPVYKPVAPKAKAKTGEVVQGARAKTKRARESSEGDVKKINKKKRPSTD